MNTDIKFILFRQGGGCFDEFIITVFAFLFVHSSIAYHILDKRVDDRRSFVFFVTYHRLGKGVVFSLKFV